MIIDSQPLTVALLATLLLGEPFSAYAGAGLLVGAAGLCLLELPPDALQTLPTQISGLPSIAAGTLVACQGCLNVRQARMMCLYAAAGTGRRQACCCITQAGTSMHRQGSAYSSPAACQKSC